MAKNILLICGSGASSGFMAAAIRKAAKKRGAYTIAHSHATTSNRSELIILFPNRSIPACFEHAKK